MQVGGSSAGSVGPKRDAMAGRSLERQLVDDGGGRERGPAEQDHDRGEQRPEREPGAAHGGPAQAAAREAQPREQPGCREGEEPWIGGLEGGEERLRAPRRSAVPRGPRVTGRAAAWRQGPATRWRRRPGRRARRAATGWRRPPPGPGRPRRARPGCPRGRRAGIRAARGRTPPARGRPARRPGSGARWFVPARLRVYSPGRDRPFPASERCTNVPGRIGLPGHRPPGPSGAVFHHRTTVQCPQPNTCRRRRFSLLPSTPVTLRSDAVPPPGVASAVPAAASNRRRLRGYTLGGTPRRSTTTHAHHQGHHRPRPRRRVRRGLHRRRRVAVPRGHRGPHRGPHRGAVRGAHRGPDAPRPTPARPRTSRSRPPAS